MYSRFLEMEDFIGWILLAFFTLVLFSLIYELWGFFLNKKKKTSPEMDAENEIKSNEQAEPKIKTIRRGVVSAGVAAAVVFSLNLFYLGVEINPYNYKSIGDEIKELKQVNPESYQRVVKQFSQAYSDKFITVGEYKELKKIIMIEKDIEWKKNKKKEMDSIKNDLDDIQKDLKVIDNGQQVNPSK